MNTRRKTIKTHRYRLAMVVGILAVVGLCRVANAWGEKLMRNVTPERWVAGDVQWCGDVSPHNKIDDMIDAAPGNTFDIVVNFKRCVEPADVNWLEDMDLAATNVQMRCKYITSVVMSNVSRADISTIASDADVAFVEEQVYFVPLLDVSVPAIKVTSGYYSPGTVEEVFPNIDGNGVNIVIMDTGVDDTVHDAFNNTPFIGGYDAFTQTFCNPDDTHGHGTHVASIALGQATANTSRGVAPAAGLIDVKAIPGTLVQAMDALEHIYDMHGPSDWNVKVINMSFGVSGANHDGKEAFSQMVDLAQSLGIVVVAAAGNDGPSNTGISTPGAATRAITVANSDCLDHVIPDPDKRDDDTIASTSSRGPRANDGDHDVLDELKPEVTAPGEDIDAARFNTTNGSIIKNGTSMAAPHVAGIAALIFQKRPGINAGSVKEIIINSAEARGVPYDTNIDPTWNDAWGWGLVDGYVAVGGRPGVATDLTFPSHPPSPFWMSPDISVNPSPKVGQKSTVTVQIENKNVDVNDVRINFGVHDFSAFIMAFHDIGTKIVDVPNGVSSVQMDWTPQNAGHLCMEVEISYGPDINYSNNKAQRNLAVARSPVTFKVKNTWSEEPNVVFFYPWFEYNYVPQWTLNITPPSGTVSLSANDCPLCVDAELIPPPGTKPGTTQIAHIQVNVGNTEAGISVQYTVPSAVIPTVTEWGLIILALLLVTAGAIAIRRRLKAAA